MSIVCIRIYCIFMGRTYSSGSNFINRKYRTFVIWSKSKSKCRTLPFVRIFTFLYLKTHYQKLNTLWHVINANWWCFWKLIFYFFYHLFYSYRTQFLTVVSEWVWRLMYIFWKIVENHFFDPMHFIHIMRANLPLSRPKTHTK